MVLVPLCLRLYFSTWGTEAPEGRNGHNAGKNQKSGLGIKWEWSWHSQSLTVTLAKPLTSLSSVSSPVASHPVGLS